MRSTLHIRPPFIRSKACGRHEHHVLRPEGHARPRHESAVGSSVKTRFYPSFFPFTEPSADVQIQLHFLRRQGHARRRSLPQLQGQRWIELLGCGMVDPNVYGFVDYDATKVSGFAFGMGVERIAILKYGVDDIQLFFFQGDVRFLEQFG